MELIEDLGKRKIGKNKRRYGLFYCEYCEREVERRIDTGNVSKSCGCLTKRRDFSTFEEWTCTECNIKKPLTEYYKNKTGFRRSCKLCVRDKQLYNKYGVTLKWYTKKLDVQKGVCDICKKVSDKTLCVDHDHDTNKVRGLLCSNCNTALGLLKENLETIKNLSIYLKKYN